MGYDFSGYVLQGPRVATTNANTTGEATNGVIRDIRGLPLAPVYVLPSPALVEGYADQYRAAVLGNTGTAEYLIWAQNTSSLALLDDPDWWCEEGTGTIPLGSLSVTDTTPKAPSTGTFTDGSSRVIVQDNGGRDIGTITHLVYARGDVDDYEDGGWKNPDVPSDGRVGAKPYDVFTIFPTYQDAGAGVAQIDVPQRISIGGGFSVGRGDKIITVRYTLAPARFWWSRNDRYQTRFGFNETRQRWEPRRGTAPKNLGYLAFDTSYQILPRLLLPYGSFLPGDGTQPDQYAMLRLGTRPDASSVPVANDGDFLGIQVRGESDLTTYDFKVGPKLSGIIGITSGIVVFNPDFAALHVGKTLWYSYENFEAEADGILGDLRGADLYPLFLAPIPGPQDNPLLRLGSRRYLSVTLVDTEGAQDAAAPPQAGEAIVALSTGRVRLSAGDTSKADPDSSSFDLLYLGEKVVYDGVALNQVPQPSRLPVALVTTGGAATDVAAGNKLYIPDALLFPGLGQSGVIQVSDGTGALPATGNVGIRPGGDNSGDTSTGMVRQVDAQVGDLFLFSRFGIVANLKVVNTTSELPATLKVPAGTAYVARQNTVGSGSQIALSRQDRSKFSGDPLYFIQAALTPALHTTQARLVSRNQYIFRFDGTEKLYFAIGGLGYGPWLSSSLPAQDFYTPDEVAASIQTIILGAGYAYAQNNRIIIEDTDLDTGSVEIGFGPGPDPDLSGAAALGFMPGWRAQGGVSNWLTDSGTSLGLYRSPVNLDRAGADPDYRAYDRISDAILQAGVGQSPFVFVPQIPMQDVAGYDVGVFFNLAAVTSQGEDVQIVNRRLKPYEDVQYRFYEGKCAWLEAGSVTASVQQTLNALPLGTNNVVPETLLGAPGIGGGLSLAETGGTYQSLKQGVDYLLPQEGASGTAVLVERFGVREAFGSQGTFTLGSTLFSETAGYFSNAQPGWRLKILNGDAAGSYTVTSVPSTTSLEVTPAFIATSPRPMTWELFSGLSRADYDPAVVADVTYKPFQHLPSEPFQVRVLTPLGLTPASPASQTASRLQADLGKALESSRPLNMRFGLDRTTSPDNQADLVVLALTEIGLLVNDVLLVPETNHFNVAAFAIQVGSVLYVQGVNLTGVLAFSTDPGGGYGVEYLFDQWVTSTKTYERGTLRFGSNILSDMAASQVYYREMFRDPADVPALTVEYAPETGYLNIGQAEITTFAGAKVYLVEQMITENGQDVSVNPPLGAFSFAQPLQAEQSVEVEYYKATVEGRKVDGEDATTVVEFLPVFVSNEVATKIHSNPSIYEFNSAGHTIDARFEPVVVIGPIRQNFGTRDFTVSYVNGKGRITFKREIALYIPVEVTYAIFEMLGGERTFDASNRPLYRPPFFIKQGVSEFGLRGNRFAEFLPGQMLRLGAECYYVKAVTYYPTRIEDGVTKGNVTGITIFPTTVQEVGSRSPGNDVLSLITGEPITTVVDPDGVSPVATTAATGFMRQISLTANPFEPIARAQTSVIFQGDLTKQAVAGTILEFGGQPYTISDVALADDGSRTTFTLTTGFKRGWGLSQNPTVKLSTRPVYPPESRDFLGVGPLVPGEPFELVLYGEVSGTGTALPGRTLESGIEYSLDSDTGALQLLFPMQAALAPAQRLVLSFTRLTSLGPFLQDRVIQLPRYKATYRFNTIPSVENGFLGGLVTGTFTFRSPDSFYFRAVPLRTYLGEAVVQAIADITSKSPAGGALVPGSGISNWQRGRIGLRTERRQLMDLDRSARVFLDFYNKVVLAHEQVLETISGGFIGDRDGKFKFFVGRGKQYAPPGYEDTITGDLNPRILWGVVFSEADPDRAIIFTLDDNVVVPPSASLTNGIVTGPFIPVNQLADYVTLQEQAAQNDVDDVVLIGRKKAKKVKLLTPPYKRLVSKGIFRQMSEQHVLSRLFPTTAKAFFTTWPGVGADESANNPGSYTAGTVAAGSYLVVKMQSTKGEPVGQLANPALGDIDTYQGGSLQLRRASGRIWGYFPKGIPADSFSPGVPLTAITDPAMIVTPLLLKDMPINPETGFPDITKLLSQGGDLADASTGDADLDTPGFLPGDQVAWGKPDGSLYRSYDRSTPILLPPTFAAVFVDQVQFGCVVTFKSDPTGTNLTISSSDDILVATDLSTGIPLEDFPIGQGDTLLSVSPVGVGTAPTDLTSAAIASGDFRLGFDVKITSKGEVIDLSMPSLADGNVFGIQEVLGQNPPKPETALEGVVEFRYDKQNPLNIPALQGLDKDDDGDWQVPYLKTTNTELDRLAEASAGLPYFMTIVDGDSKSVYPEEIVGDDGLIVSPLTGPNDPATLYTARNLTPAASLGVKATREYDLLLVEVDQPAGLPGIQGILSVGSVRTNDVEPPRFVTRTTPPPAGGPSNHTGSPVRYVLNNALTYISNNYPIDPQIPPVPPGLEIQENVSAVMQTVLDFQTSLGGFAPLLDNGSGAVPPVGPAGNFNDIWADSPNNLIRIELIRREDPNSVNGYIVPDYTVVYTIELWNGQVRGVPTAGPVPPWTPLAALPQPLKFGYAGGLGLGSYIEILTATPWFDFNAALGFEANWYLPYSILVPGVQRTIYGFEYRISVDTYLAAGYNPPGVTGKSERAYISDDRLTFNEVIDLRSAQPRYAAHPKEPLTLLEVSLDVHEVTLGNNDPSTVNQSAYTNGGVPFTFLARNGIASPGVGQFESLANLDPLPERGWLKVMGFEGFGNMPITGTDIRFSAIPSNSNIPEAPGPVPICTGTGETESKNNTFVPIDLKDTFDDRLTNLSVPVTDVQQGDVLVIKESPNPTHQATNKAGTYLIHYSVEENSPLGVAGRSRAVTLTAIAGVGLGWTDFLFPTFESYDSIGHTLKAQGDISGFPVPGILHVIVNQANISSTDLLTFQQSVLRGSYTGVNLSTGEFTGLFHWEYAQGTWISEAQFSSLLAVGMPVSGMTQIPIQTGPYEAVGLPVANVVGFHDPAGFYTAGVVKVINGFRYLRLESPTLGAVPQVLTAGVSITEGAVPPVGGVSVEAYAVPGQETFDPDIDRVMYPHTPKTLHLKLSQTQWRDINAPVAPPPFYNNALIMCLLPGTYLELKDGAGVPGFHAQAGIFLEPSYPRPVFDLSSLTPHVIDADHSVTATEIGMRNTEDYLGIGASAPAVPEAVAFEVRRIRRFHDVEGVIGQNLLPLRYAYEIRRGRLSAYTTETSQMGIVEAQFTMNWESTKPLGMPRAPDVWNDGRTYDGTNLGTFEDPNVGIRPGDTFRLLDVYGDVVEEVEITAVLDGYRLKLAQPGLQTPLPTPLDWRFEVYLKQAPVPHEQSYEQLLDLITDKKVCRTFADEIAELGGYVPTSEINKLYDDLNFPTGTQTFSAAGVKRGDIVLVDPMGTLPALHLYEQGRFPLGDQGVYGRTPTTQYVEGGPDDLDDNRGFYRITAVYDTSPPYLEVTGACTFAGTKPTAPGYDEDKIFPEDSSARSDMGYTIYPTVHQSNLPGVTEEGQMDLRPTEHSVGGSYATDNYSIRPFSYRIIRPSTLFSNEAIDLILVGRERLLSLIEILRGLIWQEKSGDYYIFQRDKHAHDLGDPTNPFDGLGVMPNAYITQILGKLDESPFVNTSSCLSIHDRRFWILDERLDNLAPDLVFGSRMYPGAPAFPASGGPYTDYTDTGEAVRPVLPDRITDILDSVDRFRPIRFTWLAYRTHKILGTLEAIRRYDAALPARLEEQERLRLLKASAGVTTKTGALIAT